MIKGNDCLSFLLISWYHCLSFSCVIVFVFKAQLQINNIFFFKLKSFGNQHPHWFVPKKMKEGTDTAHFQGRKTKLYHINILGKNANVIYDT